MRKLPWLALVLALVGAAAMSAPAQEPGAPGEIPNWTRTVLKNLQNIEKQMVDIAEDFPEELYDTYRPRDNEDVRTPAEILLHVAHLNAEIAFFMMGTKERREALAAEGKVPNLLQFRYVSKEETVVKVKEAFAAVRESILANPDPKDISSWIYVLAHSSEHFGNLVTYYRNLGLVPPTSRQ